MKITKLTVRNYRGIAALEQEIAPSGAVIAGRNGGGKTSVLRAIRAALAGQDIGPDAIRHGADKAEILVDLDDLSVRRVLGGKSPTLIVEKGGLRAPKPQTFLTELLGTSALDPLDLMLAPPKERRAKVLAALPVTVTEEQLRRWVPRLPAGFDCSGHGLDVLERLRASAYAQRTEANARAKTARADEERARVELAAVKAPADAFDLDEATHLLRNAREQEAALIARATEAAKAEERTASVRARVAELRAKATATRPAEDARPTIEEGEAAQAEVTDATAKVEQARAALLAAEDRLSAARGRVRDLVSVANAFTEAMTRASVLAAQADDLDASLAASAPEPVSAEQREKAAKRVAEATRAVEVAKAAEAFEAIRNEHAKRETAAQEAHAEAARLDGVVKALTSEAPAALLQGASAIPGLGLDGDEVTLDGVRLDGLCGAEQMRFCVEIAKRLNAKSKILVVDGLERLDPEQMDAFVTMATEGGWQLIGTRVDRGDVVIEAIEPGEHAAAAE